MSQPQPSSRSIQVIIQELLVVIPEKENALITEIKEYRNSIWNQAPEMMGSAQLWIPVQHILARNILVFDEEWKVKVQKIFVGEN
uniref:Uncharacterized protein n=1 Tax=viral metagenome TaxID=1070528 RepID=A0A6C0LDI3_9ZZZZ